MKVKGRRDTLLDCRRRSRRVLIVVAIMSSPQHPAAHSPEKRAPKFYMAMKVEMLLH